MLRRCSCRIGGGRIVRHRCQAQAQVGRTHVEAPELRWRRKLAACRQPRPKLSLWRMQCSVSRLTCSAIAPLAENAFTLVCLAFKLPNTAIHIVSSFHCCHREPTSTAVTKGSSRRIALNCIVSACHHPPTSLSSFLQPQLRNHDRRPWYGHAR